MEETWRKGPEIFVVDLVKAKAFDNVDHASIIIQIKVPYFLTNKNYLYTMVPTENENVWAVQKL